MTLVLTDVSKNAVVNALTARIDSGVSAGNLKFRTGTPPVDANAGEATGVIVATYNFPAKPSFNPGGTSPNPAGTAALNATGTSFAIGNNGPPTYFRIYTSTNLVVLQGIVGVDINVTGAAWQAGGSASISSFLINTSAPPPATVVNSGPITVTITSSATATATVSGGASETNIDNASQLTAALVNPAPGTILSLAAGVTFSGNFVIPASAANLTIKSRNLISLTGLSPTGRVSEASATNMPKISAPTGSPPISAMRITNGANGITFQGIEFTTSHISTTVQLYGLIHVGVDAASGTVNNVEFDQCYIHGNIGTAVHDGVIMYNGVTDCRFRRCHIDEIHSNDENHGIHIYKATGPVMIDDCFIEASSIGVFVGDTAAFGAIPQPTGITLKGSHLFRPFKWWSAHATYNASEAGWFQSGGGSKNFFECKSGHTVLVEGNLFENCYPGAWHGQAIMLTPIPQPLVNVTIRNNAFKECRRGITASANSWITNTSITNLVIHNNLAYTSYDYAAGTEVWLEVAATPSGGKFNGLTITHNTMVFTSAMTAFIYWGSGNDQIDNVTCTDNIVTAGQYCVLHDGGSAGSVGTANALIGYNFDTNVYVGNTGYFNFSNTTNWIDWLNALTHSAVGYVDMTFDDVGDFALASGSTYKAIGANPAGGDPGVVVADILTAMNDEATF